MEPRDDFDRAGASLRERAARLGSGHDADEVARMARRRRTGWGALAGLVVVAVVGVSVAALDQDLVERIEVEPLVPSDDAPSASEPATPEDTADGAVQDVTEPARCEPAELSSEPEPATTIGTTATVFPVGVGGAQLLAADDHAYAISRSGPVAFAVLDPSEGWQCLPSPPSPSPPGRVLGAAGGDAVLAVSTEGAARFDPGTERWTDVALPDLAGAAPADIVWTGEHFVVLFAGNGDGDSPLLMFDPSTGAWSRSVSLPTAVTRDTPTNLLWTGEKLLWAGGSEERDRARWQAARLLRLDDEWVELPTPPVSDQWVQAVLIDDVIVAVDGSGEGATFSLADGMWAEPAATGVDPGSCPPKLVAGTTSALLTACDQAAVFAGPDRRWATLGVAGSLSAATVLDDGTALAYHHGDDGDARLLAVPLDEALVRSARSDAACPDIADFAERLTNTGFAGDPGDGTPSPADLAENVDLVVAGTLTGEVEVANGPGPAGESYLAYELEVTDVVSGNAAAAGETIRVSIAFDGDPTRSSALASDVPAGASALVFAYEVTDAPGGWVAASGNGFAVACADGPPLGQVGEGPDWSDLADLDALADVARR